MGSNVASPQFFTAFEFRWDLNSQCGKLDGDRLIVIAVSFRTVSTMLLWLKIESSLNAVK